MKVIVNKVDCVGTTVIVSFSSAFGDAKAFWNGELPVPSHEYRVEVDIDDLTRDVDVSISEICQPSIKLDKELICITGCIDSVDEDGYTVIRLGDYIIPFMLIGDLFDVGTNVELRTKSITLYPYNL